jgi:HSP20 family protein
MQPTSNGRAKQVFGPIAFAFNSMTRAWVCLTMSESEDRSTKDPIPDLSGMLGLGGIFDGVSNLIHKFGELAEKGESLRSGTHHGETSTGKKITTSYGFQMKFGPSQENEPTIRPVQSSREKPVPTSTHVAPRVREPHVEIFDEGEHLLVIAEMPGVASDDVRLNFDGKKLEILGTAKSVSFRKEIELPQVFREEDIVITSNNGVIEIRMNCK